ncbi:hypothetical protein [Nitrobacter sp.]|uniref:Uncharacterized protein n=1 Tax=Nitrobacter winogradskyi TaxID=913 RepID=A0A4Y3WEA9_NITWI|nr:hypothetical protein NWI01_32490 [Nitrobacter winogradskyi]
MIKGWKISTVRPGRGASGAPRREFILVAIADQDAAVRAVKETLPDAEVKVDSEATPELIAEYQVIDGEMVVLAD